MNRSVQSLITDISTRLAPVYRDAQQRYNAAWHILEYSTGLSKEQIVIKRDCHLKLEQKARLQRVVNEIVFHNKPLQYIVGTVPFLDVSIEVRPPILIPRPETEWWTSLVRDEVQKWAVNSTPKEPFRILDMCSGSGCIGLALASLGEHINVVGLDSNPAAVTLGEYNAKKNGLSNITFFVSNLFDSLHEGEQFDLIVTNPPYISPEEYSRLPESVRNWEDKQALTAHENGLGIIKAITTTAPKYLRGTFGCTALYCEIGYKQGSAVKSLFEKTGFKTVQLLYDLSGNERLVVGSGLGGR